MEYIDEMIRIPQLEDGDKIYHYTTCAGLQGISEGLFWVTERHFLNDPTEFQVATEIYTEVISRNIQNNSTVDKFINKLNYYIDKDTSINDGFCYDEGDFVISFSLVDDNLLMWSEFSAFYGYCLKFDYTKFLETISCNDLFHAKVIYDHDKQYEIVKNGLEELLFRSEEYPWIVNWKSLDAIDNETIDKLACWSSVACELCNMFFKNDCFKGEQEYRFVFLNRHRKCERDKFSIKFREKNGILLPYIEKSINNMSSLEAVTIGPKNNSDNSTEGLKWFYRSRGLRVEIKQSEMSLR